MIQLAGEDRASPLADVLTFAHQIGVKTATADTKAAFRAEMQSDLQAASRELAELTN